jgi:hypothetical protein
VLPERQPDRRRNASPIPALDVNDVPHQAAVESQAGELVEIVEMAGPAALVGCPHPFADDLMHVKHRWFRRRDAKPIEVTFRAQGRRLDGQEMSKQLLENDDLTFANPYATVGPTYLMSISSYLIFRSSVRGAA